MTRQERLRRSPHSQNERLEVDSKKDVILSSLQMIVTVFLSDNQQLLTEVPITPETLCKDVVEFCKEAGESGCHLAEVWRGKGTSLLAHTVH